jgi:hypothetical protein
MSLKLLVAGCWLELQNLSAFVSVPIPIGIAALKLLVADKKDVTKLRADCKQPVNRKSKRLPWADCRLPVIS